ncbi:hypothetical protein BGZ60DRAFT_363019, partial [Tricladium varicosporioides]
YWFVQQAESTPTCRIDVSSTQDISTAVNIVVLSQCFFAAKGGQDTILQSVLIQNGVLINMARPLVISSSNDKVTSVGPDSTWYNVYNVLDSLGILVVEARDGSVGVSKLILRGEPQPPYFVFGMVYCHRGSGI